MAHILTDTVHNMWQCINTACEKWMEDRSAEHKIISVTLTNGPRSITSNPMQALTGLDNYVQYQSHTSYCSPVIIWKPSAITEWRIHGNTEISSGYLYAPSPLGGGHKDAQIQSDKYAKLYRIMLVFTFASHWSILICHFLESCFACTVIGAWLVDALASHSTHFLLLSTLIDVWNGK